MFFNNFNSRNFYRKINKYLAPILIFSAFVTFSIRDLNDSRFSSANFTTKSIGDFLHLNDFGINPFFSSIFVRFISFSIIIGLITFVELRNSKFRNLRNISIARISKSEGYKNADIWYFFFNSFKTQFPIIVVFITLGLSSVNIGIGNFLQRIYSPYIPSNINELSSILLLIITILLNDFIGFFHHKISHDYPFLWDLHEFHHSATEMTILSRDRASLLNDFLVQPLTLPISIYTALLLDITLTKGYNLPFYIYAFHSAMSVIADRLGHSSLKVIYPKPLSFIYMSPSLHWIHHSINPSHYDKNFGQTFPFWDKIFGTYLDESHLKDIKAFGVENSSYNKYHPLYAYTILPIKKILMRISS
tara:strand:+ start:8424 stop:9506 length:1083 start_codon:yes stop_codon:yes gene_type:complete